MKSICAGVLLSALLLGLTADARAEKLRTHFDFDALLGQPAFFDFVVLGAPGPARWVVVADDTAPSPPKAAAQVFASRPDGSIAAGLRHQAVLRDGEWSVSIKRAPARGGLVFRVADPRNFLALLVDCESGAARLLCYHDGRSSELATGHVRFDTDWGRLEVKGNGPEISATWDGKPLLEGTDPHPVTGRAGMATAGPGSASFDELVIDTGSDAQPVKH